MTHASVQHHPLFSQMAHCMEAVIELAQQEVKLKVGQCFVDFNIGSLGSACISCSGAEAAALTCCTGRLPCLLGHRCLLPTQLHMT